MIITKQKKMKIICNLYDPTGRYKATILQLLQDKTELQASLCFIQRSCLRKLSKLNEQNGRE